MLLSHWLTSPPQRHVTAFPSANHTFPAALLYEEIVCCQEEIPLLFRLVFSTPQQLTHHLPCAGYLPGL